MKTWLIDAKDAAHADEIVKTICLLCPDREGVKVSSFCGMLPGQESVEIMVQVEDGAEGAEALVAVLESRTGETSATS